SNDGESGATYIVHRAACKDTQRGVNAAGVVSQASCNQAHRTLTYVRAVEPSAAWQLEFNPTHTEHQPLGPCGPQAATEGMRISSHYREAPLLCERAARTVQITPARAKVEVTG